MTSRQKPAHPCSKPVRVKQPIMSRDDERFMALEGLLQWTFAVVQQSERLSTAHDRKGEPQSDPAARRQAALALHTECHFFAIAAYKLIEHRDWALNLGLCAAVEFGEINEFSVQDIKDLRNMREHVVDYFQGVGLAPGRWVYETPEYKADASSLNGTMIGGRLDWVKFAVAARGLLPTLLAEPIPCPPLANNPKGSRNVGC